MGKIATATGAWLPFDDRVFGEDLGQSDPANCMAIQRIGVVDVGSNSIRLVVFDGAVRSPAYFYNEKVMAALGEGFSETGRLSPKGKVRAMAALARFAALARGMGIELSAVATAAVREASDGPAFCDEVLRETGIELHVIPGEEEARLSAQGVLLGWPRSYGMVCDIGGSSMELADLADGKIGQRVTSPLGPLKLREVKGGQAGLDAYIAREIATLHESMQFEAAMRLFLVGGSWRAIARIDMERRNYPLTIVHEYRMTAEAVAATRAYIADADLNDLRGRCDISEDRMALVPLAIQVLDALCQTFQPKDIAVSSYGIREGLLYEQMSPALRETDPLIASARHSEAQNARLPGFGDVLYDFIMPLFPDADWQRKRIIRAACLLHDVSWRAHPDFRAEVCFENATRANLGGLKHEERIFLGMALMHRYSSKKQKRFADIFAYLPEDEQRQAAILGRAMRLGAMLWIGAHEAPGTLVLRRDGDKLEVELSLERRAEPLFGEVAQARLKNLANAMGAKHSVVITDC
ncbi:Ppx/GppA family phosphatase [Ketogulonicigenium vulgare]|uniref:Phosphatase, Ppx/GppA family protein n=1 Tax=Ketogulonicigenium vulgare (strain WSH-001) TaxID=759362 RepID=F9Y9W5_KETVW|nr:Ppx/GppA family phosphatase [Ketogulonicigenium vulgare]AEM40217.1 Phosphatase, Ppx/GppA family protein [Ketogulonicigenium vulgare WSH-001]ALJ80421.1 exopolyphosphatase [Ketogulonicigenium vulgare]ANW33250.1 exopolyphosphatase [Ketogulonicigenium vulgare]AOZ53923.1 Ppx/GppA family phosphatase, putative [Ketogulonicigenium vulgare]